MPIYSLQDLRATAPENLRNAPDEVLLTEYSKSVGADPAAVAKYLGYGQSGGMAANRVSAGIDNYQANLYGLGGAVSRAVGAEDTAQWFDQRRVGNEFNAALATQRARDLGAVDDWRDVGGVGDAFNYVGGLAAQSLPYLGEAAAGALTGGLALGPTALRMGLTRGVASMAGAAAASYPSAVGDVLSAQRDAGGENLGTAMVGGVPYAALNALGVEGLVARGLRPIAAAEGPLMRRMATGAATTALGEGVSETGQEGVNQYFGRMAVDPNETFFNEGANRRYLDSFVGGAALGGVFGGVGGMRRPVQENQPYDLTKRNLPSEPPLGLGYSPLAGTPIVFPDGSVALNGEQELAKRYGTVPDFGAQEAAAEQPAAAAAPAPSAVFTPQEQRLLDMGIKATGKRVEQATQVLDAMEVAGLPDEQQFVVTELMKGGVIPGAQKALDLFVEAQKYGLTDEQLEVVRQAAMAREFATAKKKLADLIADVRREAAVAPKQQNVSNVGGAVAPTLPAGAPVAAGVSSTPAPSAVAPVAPAAAGIQATTPPAPVSDSQPTDLVQRRKKRVVDAAALKQSQAFVAPESTIPYEVIDQQQGESVSAEDQAVIGEMTGGNVDVRAQLEEEAGARSDATAVVGDDLLPRLLAERFKGSKNAARDTEIATAYITAVRAAPKGSKIKIQEAIGTKYGIKPVAVRKIGNVADLVRAGAAIGMGEAEVRAALEVNDTAKTTTQAKPDEEAQATDDRQLTDGLRAAGVESVDGETAGFGFDDSRTWSAPEDTAEAKANAVQSIMDQQERLRATMEEMESQGQLDVAGEINAQIEALDAKLQALIAEYASYLEGNKAKKAAAKKSSAVKTPSESARDAWDKVARTYDGAPSFDELPEDVQERWVEYGEDNWGESDVAIELARIQRESGFENIERLASASAVYGDGRQRAPSLRREIAKLQKMLDSGALTPDAFASRVELAMKMSERDRTRNPRERGADYIRQRLLEAKRRGDLSEQAVDMAEWFIQKNPALVDDLAISIRSSRADGASGNYDPLRRLMTLIKESSNDETTVHEILHHLERMMPEPVQAAVRSSWLKSMAKAVKAAERAGDKDLKRFYDNLLSFHLGDGGQLRLKESIKLLKDGKVSYDHYQHVNPSEFWAVNGSRIVQGRFDAKGTVLARLKQWLRELGQKIKALFGLQSDAPIIKALDSLAKADGKFVTSNMLMEGASGYDMFVGRQALNSDKISDRRFEGQMKRYAEARLMQSNGVPADEIWRKTGWEKNPDGRWRFEISDKGAKFKRPFESLTESKMLSTSTTYKLGDVLDHPALFEAYPELADVSFVKKTPVYDFFQGTQGWFSELENEIAVTPYSKDPLSTLLHEVQHWVQMKEKFAPGGNPEATKLTNTSALGKLLSMLNGAKQDGAVLDYSAKKVMDSLSTLVDPAVQEELGIFERERAAAEKALKDAEEAEARLGQEIADELKAEGRAYDAARKKLLAEWEALRAERSKHRFGTPEYTRLKDAADAKWGEYVAFEPPALSWHDPKYKARRDAAADAVSEAQANLKGVVADEESYIKSLKIAEGDVKYYMYKLISGEAEARNTQRRQSMSALDRRRLSPAETTDVPYDNQVVTDRLTGKSASVLENIERLPEPLRQPVNATWDALQDFGSKALDRVMFTSDLVDRAAKMGLKSANRFAELLGKRGAKARELESRVERIADMFALVPDHERQKVNTFLFESTRQGKWGYGKYRDASMGETFDALSKPARDFIQAVFKHGDDVLAQKKRTVLDNTASEYDAMIAAETDEKDKAKLEKDKADTLKRFERLFQIREGMPYAPIKRMGTYVVIARSPEYRAAEEAGDAKKLRELEQSDMHYHVSFTDTKGEARALVQQLQAEPQFADDVVFREREKFSDDMMSSGGMLQALGSLRAKIEAGGGKGSSQMLRAISELYLEALAESSARKSEMRRRGIAGDVDMLRSFTAQGRADAIFMSGIEFGQDIRETFQKMRAEVRRAVDETRASELYNELTLRYAQSMDVPETPWINKLTRATSIWFLASSPAYYLQNLTQPWMMSLPAMAGRHNYAKVASLLGASYGDLKDVMKSAKLFSQSLDFDKVSKNPDEQQAIRELVNRGKIDIGMETELGEFRVDSKSAAGNFINRIDKGMRLAVQKVESLNRLTTALTAYRLERQAGRGHEQALAYAERILNETHGDYTRFNAPRAFNTAWGKVALQFRKFQLIQLSFYAKLLRDAFTNPAERAVALKTLGYSLAHTGAMAGLMGLPGYAAIAWLLGAALGDDDEPFDLTEKVRELIGDEQLATMILRGAPTLGGADLSGKVGSGNMLSIMPFSNADLTTTAGITEAFGTLAGGASLGLVARGFDGANLMLGGDWYKGMEKMLPKGLGDAMKAYRINQDGLTKRNGDVLLPADEVSAVESAMQAIGFMPADQAVTYERRDRAYKLDEQLKGRSSDIKRAFTEARRKGDAQAMAEARQEWQALQEARRRQGFKVQPMSELLKAPQEAAKRQRNTAGGIQYDTENRAYALRQAGM